MPPTCLPPPFVFGKGLEHIQSALEKSKTGVSAMKVVVELQRQFEGGGGNTFRDASGIAMHTSLTELSG